MLLSFISPFVWMPLAYASLLGFWLTTLPWVREKGLGFWIFFALAIAILVVWVLSEGALSAKLSGATIKVSPWQFWALVALDLIALVALILGKAGKQRMGWLAFFCLAAVIVVQASNSGASAGRMVHFFMTYFHWEQSHAEYAVVIIRKTIHVCFYGLLAYSAFRAAGQAGLKRSAWVLFALGAALIVASFEETRQTTQVGRGGSFWDVLLDMSGAGAALLLANSIGAKRPKQVAAKRAQ